MSDTFLDKVRDEIIRTRTLHPNQEENVDLHAWLPILVEEVGEVANDMNEHTLGNLDNMEFLDHIQYELVQVAAMAMRMAVAAKAQQLQWTRTTAKVGAILNEEVA